MSVTGFEREHVCPGTYLTPPLPSYSASLAPPPPLRLPSLSFTPLLGLQSVTKTPISAHMLVPCTSFGGLLPIPSQKLISSPAHYLFASFVVKLHHSLTPEVYFL